MVEERLPTLLYTTAFQPGLVVLRGWAGDAHKGSAPPNEPWTAQNQEQIWRQARVSVSVWHPFSSPLPSGSSQVRLRDPGPGPLHRHPQHWSSMHEVQPNVFQEGCDHQRVKIDQQTPNRQGFSTLPLTSCVTLGKWTIISVIHLKNGVIFVLPS